MDGEKDWMEGSDPPLLYLFLPACHAKVPQTAKPQRSAKLLADGETPAVRQTVWRLAKSLAHQGTALIERPTAGSREPVLHLPPLTADLALKIIH